jgi:hypothetical protein
LNDEPQRPHEHATGLSAICKVTEETVGAEFCPREEGRADYENYLREAGRNGRIGSDFIARWERLRNHWR